jgi:hypothetical protein
VTVKARELTVAVILLDATHFPNPPLAGKIVTAFFLIAARTSGSGPRSVLRTSVVIRPVRANSRSASAICCGDTATRHLLPGAPAGGRVLFPDVDEGRQVPRVHRLELRERPT